MKKKSMYVTVFVYTNVFYLTYMTTHTFLKVNREKVTFSSITSDVIVNVLIYSNPRFYQI